MKKLIAFTIMGICFALSACTSSPKADISMTAKEMGAKLNTDDQFAMPIENIDPSIIAENIGLDMEKVEDSYFLDPPMVKANTLYIVKAKTDADVAPVKEALEKKKQMVVDSFERYLPDQYEIAKKGEVVTNGKYVMLAIAEDTGKAVKSFNEFFK